MTSRNRKTEEIYLPCINGTLHCTVQGEGSPLVFLHGALGTGVAHFRDQIDYFSNTYKVFLPDFLGHGQSGKRKSFKGNFYEEDSRDIGCLISYLGLDPVNLCGFSDGSIVAMMVAKNYPGLVRCLVTIGGQSVSDDRKDEFRRTFTPIENLPQSLKQALARHHGDPYWRELVESYLEASEEFYEKSGGVFITNLEDITVPTLIIHGESDPWSNSSNANALRDGIINSRVITFPNTGHEVQREKATEFNRTLMNFLSNI